ncbi:hypothetical protein [Trinickia sp.]|uniref:hypothetical protein n=1 Tax=Trinickia sp. TaxID=2571163 RepID=UPI003F7D70D6
MIRAPLACAGVIALAGCAGTAHYSVSPFYEPALGRMVCCRADATNSKDISSLQFDLAEQPGGTVTVHFTETGVGATAPIKAEGATTAAVAGAVSNAATAVIKLTK